MEYDLSIFEGIDAADVPGQIGRVEERIAASARVKYESFVTGRDDA